MDGILLVKKEKDYTSRDIVNIISKVFHTKKVGHTGTLDPLATGVLVVTIGQATKISELLTCTYKEYIAEVKLGIETDTLDITGTILKEENKDILKEEIEKALKEIKGKYEQTVPLYSAVKINGKKLYEYARNKEEVVLPKRLVDIKEIELLDYKKDNDNIYFTFKTTVSKGCYIRSLIKDIATKLNTIGVMTNLVRTKQGSFDIENAYTLSEIADGNYHLIPIEEALELKQVVVDDNLAFKIKNGQIIDNIYQEDVILFKKEKILAIYKKYDQDPNKLKPWKMFGE
jgi:tRNA pseudouridine55 synthase